MCPQFAFIKFCTPEGTICGRWWGPRNVRPILCVHGWQDNCGAYDKLIPLLPTNYAYLAFDLPGHGLSFRYAPGMNYNYYDIVLLIERIRKVFGWEKVSLMGHSLGSMCSYFYAATFSEKIDLLISLDNFTPREFDLAAKMREDMTQLLVEDDRVLAKGSNTEPPSYSYDQLLDKIVEGSQFSVDLESAQLLLTRSVKKSTKYPDMYYFHYDRRIRGFACPACSSRQRMKTIKSISCPVLFLMGKDSYMRKYRMDPTVEEIKGVMRSFSYQYGPGNHHFLLTHPEEYADSIAQFLDKYRGTRAKL